MTKSVMDKVVVGYILVYTILTNILFAERTPVCGIIPLGEWIY